MHIKVNEEQLLVAWMRSVRRLDSLGAQPERERRQTGRTLERKT